MDLISLLAIGGALLLSNAKKTADKLEFFPQNLELINGKLIYKMEILNPTASKLKVDSFFGGIFMNDKKIGSIEKGEGFTLTKKGRTEVSFPVKLVGTGAISLIADAIKGKLKNSKFKILGIARALGTDNDVQKEISLNG